MVLEDVAPSLGGEEGACEENGDLSPPSPYLRTV